MSLSSFSNKIYKRPLVKNLKFWGLTLKDIYLNFLLTYYRIVIK